MKYIIAKSLLELRKTTIRRFLATIGYFAVVLAAIYLIICIAWQTSK